MMSISGIILGGARLAVAWMWHHLRVSSLLAAAACGGLVEWWSRPGAARLAQIDSDAEEVACRVREIGAEHGAAAAHAVVRQTYAAEMDRLNDKDQQRAAALSRDPDALAAFLVRASGSEKKPL